MRRFIKKATFVVCAAVLAAGILPQDLAAGSWTRIRVDLTKKYKSSPKAKVNTNVPGVTGLGREAGTTFMGEAWGWSGPQVIDIGTFLPLDIASDGNGNFMALLSQRLVGTGEDYGLYISRYDRSGRWGAAEQISVIPSTRGYEEVLRNASIAMDGVGNALVAYLIADDILVKRFTVGRWEGEPTHLGTGKNPRIVMDSEGYALVFWKDGSTVVSRSYLPGVGWERDTYPIQTLLPEIELVAASVSYDGYGMVIWKDARPMLYSKTFHLRERWWVSPIPMGGSVGFDSFALGMGAGGNALFLFHVVDREGPRVRMRWYQPTVGWGLTDILAETSAPPAARFADVGFDARGNAIAVWISSDQVEATRFEGGRRGETAELGTAYEAHLAVDSDGNAIVIWVDRDSSRLTFRRYTPRP